MTMMYTVLAKAAEDMGGAFSPERLSLAGQMTLIGMAMIFSVLTILWVVLSIFKLIFAKPAKKVVKPEVKVEEVKTPTPAPATAAIETESDDGALIALITAAIVAYEASNGNEVAPNGFRVVSFRRTNGGRAWNSK